MSWNNPDDVSTNPYFHPGHFENIPFLPVCKDAYPSDGLRRDACELGSKKMFEIQSKAPVASGGLLVYMGAGDRSMIVIQPPDNMLDSSSGAQDNDWVLLNSFRSPSHDYELSSTYKLTETHVQTMPISEHGHRFGEYRRLHTAFCIPAWLWLIPVMLLMALVYIQYGTTLKSVMVEESEDELEQEILLEQQEQGKEEEDDFQVQLQLKADKDTFLISFHPLEFIEAKLQDLPPKYDDQEGDASTSSKWMAGGEKDG